MNSITQSPALFLQYSCVSRFAVCLPGLELRVQGLVLWICRGGRGVGLLCDERHMRVCISGTRTYHYCYY